MEGRPLKARPRPAAAGLRYGCRPKYYGRPEPALSEAERPSPEDFGGREGRWAEIGPGLREHLLSAQLLPEAFPLRITERGKSERAIDPCARLGNAQLKRDWF